MKKSLYPVKIERTVHDVHGVGAESFSVVERTSGFVAIESIDAIEVETRSLMIGGSWISLDQTSFDNVFNALNKQFKIFYDAVAT